MCDGNSWIDIKFWNLIISQCNIRSIQWLVHTMLKPNTLFDSCFTLRSHNVVLKLVIRDLVMFVSLDTISCVVSVGCWTLLSWPGRDLPLGVCTAWLMPFFLVVAATCQLNCFIAIKQTLVWTEGTTGATQSSVRSDWSLHAYSPGLTTG